MAFSFENIYFWSCKDWRNHLIKLQSPWQTFLTGTQDNLYVQEMVSEKWCSIKTNGNGACSVRFIFGKPTLCQELKCENVRERAIQSMGRTFAEFKRRVRDDILAEAIATMLWGDLVYPCALRDADSEAFQTLKPERKKQAETSFARLL